MKSYEEIKEMMEEFEDDYEYVGLRFEEREYKVGDIVANSKSNMDREDVREFPEYGTEEYEEMPELPGASAWNKYAWHLKDINLDNVYQDHVYIIAGRIGWYDAADEQVLDDYEIVIEDAKVMAIIK